MTTQKKYIRSMGILVLAGLCCIALVSPVAALYPDDKWLTNNVTVLANSSNYATINGVQFTNNYFFAVTGNGHYNFTNPAWNWTQNTTYTDRYYMEQISIVNDSDEYWYPADPPTPGGWLGDWQWVFIDKFGTDATIYKKSLGDQISPSISTYYAWYGNRTAANTYYQNRSDWMVPTYQNATYLINLTVTS